jgi:CheY-like chemotaxis protein
MRPDIGTPHAMLPRSKDVTNTRKIMLLHYDADISTLMEELLLGEGYTVGRGDEASATVEMVARTQPDLLMIDLHRAYPDDTLGFLDHLRQNPATSAIGMLVGSTDAPLLRQLGPRLRGLDCATLLMPFDIDELVTCVDRACQSHGLREIASGEGAV